MAEYKPEDFGMDKDGPEKPAGGEDPSGYEVDAGGGSPESPPPPPGGQPAPEPSSQTPGQSPSPADQTPPLTGSPQAYDAQQTTWAMACHLAGLCLLLLPPIGGALGSLIIWLIKRDGNPFIDDQGKEALNFQVSVMAALLVLGVLTMIPVIGCIPGLLALVVVPFHVVFTIIGAIKASQGQQYRYPIRFDLFG